MEGSVDQLYHQKLESLGYIFAADSIGLSSFKSMWWTAQGGQTRVSENIIIAAR